MKPLYMVLLYCFVISLCGFVMMGQDKKKAKKGQWRTKERTLLGIAFLGGALGIGLGMSFFRHKTKTLIFQILVPIFLILNLLVMYYFLQWM